MNVLLKFSAFLMAIIAMLNMDGAKGSMNNTSVGIRGSSWSSDDVDSPSLDDPSPDDVDSPSLDDPSPDSNDGSSDDLGEASAGQEDNVVQFALGTSDLSSLSSDGSSPLTSNALRILSVTIGLGATTLMMA
ncbi:hypothetical protein IV203_030634 [Nitzschia inconspicua]|uniref:Uncharacterized protein n=1 Tax=Nitzschia inconspicua TaxID=303405 RepID=A0A9K3LWC8_9STRA|nr:hypothetical protein IV203_030634 [Nitzschia inconspicua]